MSGRVTFDGQAPENYELYEGEMKPQDFQNSLRGIQDNNVLNKAFFSQRNINNIQKQIQKKVLETTNYTIGRQSDLQLQIIMRSIFLQYSKNQPCNLKQQVEDLNRKVLDYAVNRIIIEISQYLEYKDTVAKLPMPLNHPRNLSNSGTKSLSFFKPL